MNFRDQAFWPIWEGQGEMEKGGGGGVGMGGGGGRGGGFAKKKDFNVACSSKK